MTQPVLIGGRYRLDEMIAEGGMGEVWRAHDELLDRSVAVKLLRSALTSDPTVAERFRREARAAASLSHPNMANVYDYIEEDNHPGIVMELVTGSTLGDVIAEQAPMGVQRAVDIVDQVLAALEVAHAAGLVHRDIKPANVMIDTQSNVKVADFGIARALGESTLTETGTVLGSVHYLSPEQLHGGSLQPASDLYAVGVILYEMLTAKRPFEGETPVAVAMTRLNNTPERPRRLRNDIPPELDRVIMHALERDPAERFATAKEMRAALAEALRSAQSRVSTMPIPMTPPTKPAEHTMVLPAADAEATTVLRPQAAKPPKPKRSRRVGGFRPALLVAAMVVLSIALGALAFRGPSKVTVPSFAGMSLTKARTIAADRHLRVVVSGAVNSNRAKNTVVGQTPDSKTVVKSGATIRLTISNGVPPCCTVPDVIGKTRKDAEDALQKAGLTFEVRYVITNDQEDGHVADQTPGTGTHLARGDKVTLYVALSLDRKRRGKGGD